MGKRVLAIPNKFKTILHSLYSSFSRLDSLLAWFAIFLYNIGDKMGDKISKAKKHFDDITTQSSSRWGIFFALLALGGLFITIGLGGLANMNGFVIAGLTMFAVAIGFAVYWLIKKSKDTTATRGDIEALGTKLGEFGTKIETAINNLANEIRLERENRGKKTNSDESKK